MQVRGSVEEAEELQDDDETKGEDGEQQVQPASRERQKEILGRMPVNDRQRPPRQVDYSPYEPRQRSDQGYDSYNDDRY